MASTQGNYDNSANAPIWATSTVHLPVNAANSVLLYGNTSPNVFFSNATVGLFAVDDNEVSVQGYGAPGWVLRTVGQGGRAGRVIQETLSVVSSFRTDNNSDDALYPDTSIVILTQPSRAYVQANTSNANSATFTVSVAAKPVNATVSYVWQYNSLNGAQGWTNILNSVGTQAAHTTFAGNTSATLTVTPESEFSVNTSVFRVTATATSVAGITNATATSVTSANAQIIIYPV